MRVTSPLFVFLVLGLSACVTAKDLREGGRHTLGGGFTWDIQPLLKAESVHELQSSLQDISDKFDKALSQQKNAKVSLSDLLASAIGGFPLNTEYFEGSYVQHYNDTATVTYGDISGNSTGKGFMEYRFDNRTHETKIYGESVDIYHMSNSNPVYSVSRTEGRVLGNESIYEIIERTETESTIENEDGFLTVVRTSSQFMVQLTDNTRPGETIFTEWFTGETNDTVSSNSYTGKNTGSSTVTAELITLTASGEGSGNYTLHTDKRQSQRESNLPASMFVGAKHISADISEESGNFIYTQAINEQIMVLEGASPFSVNFTETSIYSGDTFTISSTANGYEWQDSPTLKSKNPYEIQLLNIMNIFK